MKTNKAKITCKLLKIMKAYLASYLIVLLCFYFICKRKQISYVFHEFQPLTVMCNQGKLVFPSPRKFPLPFPIQSSSVSSVLLLSPSTELFSSVIFRYYIL